MPKTIVLLLCIIKFFPSGIETWVAKELGVVHSRHCGCQQNQRESLSEQHGHPETSIRRGVWFLRWTTDPGQGKTFERLNVFAVLTDLQPVSVCTGMFWRFSIRLSYYVDFTNLGSSDDSVGGFWIRRLGFKT